MDIDVKNPQTNKRTPPQYQWGKIVIRQLFLWEEILTDKGSTRFAKRKAEEWEKGVPKYTNVVTSAA